MNVSVGTRVRYASAYEIWKNDAGERLGLHVETRYGVVLAVETNHVLVEPEPWPDAAPLDQWGNVKRVWVARAAIVEGG
jgi:hypothetical protein